MSNKERLCYSFLIRVAARVAQRYGVEPTTLLENTGIPPESLSDPYQPITRAQERHFYRNLIHAIDIPWLGLEIGSNTSISELGSVGHASLASSTIRDVISGSHKYASLFYGHLHWETELTADEVVHTGGEEEPLGELKQFLIDRAIATLQCHTEELLGPESKPTIVNLPFPNPGYRERYEAMFQCPVHFNQPIIEMRYSAQPLDHPIATHDPKVKEVLDGLCETLRRKLEVKHDAVTDVALALREEPGSFPNIEQVAEKLGLSSRTLRRQLSQCDSSFQNLLNEARREVAEEHLQHSTMAVQQIALLCGFSEAQNFALAFKRWTGQSPTEFRHSNASGQ